jgi:Xaa-Pro aminopeptidase
MTEEFIKRRKKLFTQLRDNSVSILFSERIKYRNNDVTFKFRQSSNFFYLTGINDPFLALILIKVNRKCSSTLICNRPNEKDRIWTGQIPSNNSYKSKYKLDNVIYFDQVDGFDVNCLNNLYFEFNDRERTEDLLTKINKTTSNRYNTNTNYLSSRFNLSSLIFKMRLVKSKHEIKEISKAASISSQAHINLMKTCKAGLKEYQIESEFIKVCMNNECDQAYPAIVAAGKNGTILHYTDNKSSLKNNDLLLVDAAAEYNNYASDITRTIPVSGKFNEYQKIIYNIVLNAQEAAIKSCTIGKTLLEIHDIAVRSIIKGLIEVKLLSGSVEKNLKNEKYKKFYMHNTGHWLGLDVHDPCPYVLNGQPVKFKPGMIFTVEPGIYISSNHDIDKNYHNIAIRIEDDVLITNGEPIVLSKNVPKSITDIESLMTYVSK